MSGTDNLWYELWLYKGDLVLSFHLAVGGYAALWTTGTGGRGATAWMQNGGDFVSYDRDGGPLWALGANGCGSQGAWLRVQRDANLVLYTRGRTPIRALNDGPSSRPCRAGPGVARGGPRTGKVGLPPPSPRGRFSGSHGWIT